MSEHDHNPDLPRSEGVALALGRIIAARLAAAWLARDQAAANEVLAELLGGGPELAARTLWAMTSMFLGLPDDPAYAPGITIGLAQRAGMDLDVLAAWIGAYQSSGQRDLDARLAAALGLEGAQP